MHIHFVVFNEHINPKMKHNNPKTIETSIFQHLLAQKKNQYDNIE